MNSLVRFGPEDQLCGVLSAAASGSGPILVLPNAGLVPRAGPFRLHVELAERLAARGIRTFRFDTPGVGEAPRLPGCGVQEATIAALDRLASEHGGERFVVGGVCSAADLGWSTAVLDRRVVGMLMLDGVAFAGPWFHFARLMGVLERGPREWLGILRRWLGRAAATRQAGGLVPGITDYRDWPDRASARRLLAELVARGTRSLWIYTGGYSDLFLHPRQFGRMFGKLARDPLVAMHYWPDCDHTFYARAHRDRLLDTVEAWMVQRVAPMGAGS